LHRWTHFAVMCCVFGLILTGLPLKFSLQPAIAGLTRLVIDAETLGFLHRLFAVFLTGVALFHFASFLLAWKNREKAPAKRFWRSGSPLPTMTDVRQFKAMLRWFLKKAGRPNLDYWCYWEKFDYLSAGIIIAVLAVSGIFLWFPAFFAKFFSGYWFNVAMIVHGYAGLLGMGSIMLIHLLNTSLRIKEFPFNTVMFTGQISRSELRIERPAQYARLAEGGALEELSEPAAAGLKLKIAVYATAVSQLLGVGLIILIAIAIIS